MFDIINVDVNGSLPNSTIAALGLVTRLNCSHSGSKGITLSQAQAVVPYGKSAQFSKIDVNGENAIPLYKWIVENTKFEGFDKNPMGLMLGGVIKKYDKDYKENSKIKWNFTKILIDREGKIVSRFEPTTDMKKVKAKVEELL